MVNLSVNVNKIALLRNSRGGNLPDLGKLVQQIESFGAQGITVHPRPDQRHIRYNDIPLLKQIVRTELNIEGFPSEEFLDLVCAHIPHQCTLVPDPPQALTSNKGWDIKAHQAFLMQVIDRLHDKGIRVSIFIDDNPLMVRLAHKVGADRIELFTGPYAVKYQTDPKKAIVHHIECSEVAQEIGIGVNAGHDLNLDNLKYYKEQVKGLLEVSIGHALVADALIFGLHNTIQMYKRCLV